MVLLGKNFGLRLRYTHLFPVYTIHSQNILERWQAFSQFVLASPIPNTSTFCVRLPAAGCLQGARNWVCYSILVFDIFLLLFLDSISSCWVVDATHRKPELRSKCGITRGAGEIQGPHSPNSPPLWPQFSDRSRSLLQNTVMSRHRKPANRLALRELLQHDL